MSFNSVIFIIFLPVVFALYYVHGGRRWQNIVLVIASYIFYGWWDYRFCALLLASSLLDYTIGRCLGGAGSVGRRRFLLGLSLAGNLGVLGFFKYYGFFADSVAIGFSALGWEVSTTTLNIVLPVGISFYTFQTLSYTIDIYRGELEARQDLLDYLTFVAFFPQLVAGPIERAKHLLPQFAQSRRFSHADAVDGCRLMLWGFAKKMVLADNLGRLVDEVFAHATAASGAELVVATVCFGFQIYGDFSGYSDIATGTARLFGVQLQRNFNFPYFSRNLTEFWRRWHISLSTWFRDYVYRPLGGSRCDAVITARNIMITFLLSGLWHGAAWHFVAWGGAHGCCLLLSRWFAGRNPASN
ncbi:MAG TPA: MBOAT family O-acyltransferase, partial [Candidatus Paceibacterota bacterium]|nr:MBOAT family O-acyltransferase [Candidatus Paceibacterota bacterium]